MANSEFGGIGFSGKLRPSQTAASEIIKKQLAAGEKQLHIVAPPGSGKTILGLYVWADLVRLPHPRSFAEFCNSSPMGGPYVSV